jgi:hypothetical protein
VVQHKPPSPAKPRGGRWRVYLECSNSSLPGGWCAQCAATVRVLRRAFEAGAQSGVLDDGEVVRRLTRAMREADQEGLCIRALPTDPEETT